MKQLLSSGDVKVTSTGDFMYAPAVVNTSTLLVSSSSSAYIGPPARSKPCLQSSRILPMVETAAATNISKTLINKMSVLLDDLGLPDNLIPTRNVCDLYDEVQ